MSHPRRPILRPLLAVLALLTFAGCAGVNMPLEADDAYPLYALRTYTTNEGKLDALEAMVSAWQPVRR